MNIFEDINQKSDYFRQELAQAFSKAGDKDELEIDEPAGFSTSGSFIFGDVPPKKKTAEYLNAAVGWVYACVSAVADAVAKANYRLYKTGKDGEIVEVPDHQSLDLLYKVNNQWTKFDHFWLSQQYLELTGESPWFIDRGKSGDGEPQNILLLRPDRLDIKKGDAKSAGPIAGYTYRTDLANKIELDIGELIFLKYPDPINPYRGKGTLQAAARTADIDEYSEEFNRRFFFNSARPDSLLTTEQKLTPRQRETIKQDIKRLYAGKENAHKTAILEQGLDWKPMTLTQKDMDFMNQQKFSMMKILSIFRTPKPIVAVSDDVNLANAKIAEYVFAKWTITPKLERIVSQLNEFFLPMFKDTENMFLVFDDPVPSDIDLDLKRYDSGLGRGWMTINEVRKEAGYDDIGEDGDKIYIPNSMIPVDQAGQGLQLFSIKPKNRPENKKAFYNDIIRRSAGGYHLALRRQNIAKRKAVVEAEKEKRIEDIERKIDKIAYGMVQKIVQAKMKNVKKQSDHEHKHREVDQKFMDFADVFLKKADDYEKDFTKMLVDQFRRQKDKVLNQAPKKATIDIDDFLIDENDESQILIDAATPKVRRIVTEQGERAAKLVGAAGSFDERTKRVREYIKNRVFRFSFEVSQETNRLLKDNLNQGIAEGEGVPQLRKRVEDVFDGMEKYRSERIARSEVIRASNFGNEEAYRQSGVVEEKEWLATDDDRICEWCSEMDGERVKLSENFFDRGDKFRGNEGGLLDLDYESVKFPPLHPSCRCTMIPVIK